MAAESHQWMGDTKRWNGQMGLPYSDGAVTQTCFNDFGTHSPCAVSGNPQGTAVFGWVSGSVSSGRHFTLPPVTGAVTGAAEWDADRGSCRAVLLKLIRHAVPVRPTGEYSVCVCLCVCIMRHWKDGRHCERTDLNTCLLLCGSLLHLCSNVRTNRVLLNRFEAQAKPTGADCHFQKHAGTLQPPGGHGNAASFTDWSLETPHSTPPCPSSFHWSVITVKQGQATLVHSIIHTQTLKSSS